MAIRIYRSYDESALRGKTLEHLATLFNYRNHPSASEWIEIAAYRDIFGTLAELRFDIANHKVTVWAQAGGAHLGEFSTDGVDIEHTILNIEFAVRTWSRGFVPCGDCGVLLRRFSEDIVLAYHGGRYCATCAPKYAHVAKAEMD